MSDHWLIEERGLETWAWSLEDLLFLRLHPSGMGRLFDLKGEECRGEFRWKTSSHSTEFAQMSPEMWVELLKGQISDANSDLLLARHFHLSSPQERAWRLVKFERGSRESFCCCVRFLFLQEEFLRLLAQHKGARQPAGFLVRFRLEGRQNLRWDCNFGWFFSGGPHFRELNARLDAVLKFFGPTRDAELVAHRRTSSDFTPALYEVGAPINFSVALEPGSVSSHEHLESFLRLQELFADFLAPGESARLLELLCWT